MKAGAVKVDGVSCNEDMAVASGAAIKVGKRFHGKIV
jgi:hypothetical protein